MILSLEFGTCVRNQYTIDWKLNEDQSRNLVKKKHFIELIVLSVRNVHKHSRSNNILFGGIWNNL